MRKAAILTICLCAIAGAPADANDSSAELATGGLVLEKSDNIAMRSEDLFISAKEIRVSARFYNSSAKDITTLVAFPMPDISGGNPDELISVPTEDPENPLNFATTVDGKPVAVRLEQKAFAGGLDRTEVLRRLGVPLAPRLAATNAALDRLPPSAQDELTKLDLIGVDEYDAGKGMERHLYARWTLKATYFWEQTFPTKTEVVIAHHYIPSVGVTVQTAIGLKSVETEPWFIADRAKYCMDADFLAAVERESNEAKMDYGSPFSEQRISYILTSGSNWAGPIGKFRLVIDKGAPSSLVSFCGEGVKKISQTEFETVKTDFVPKSDLHVLILKRINTP